MGKGTNQIATFADLQSIGYRIPSTISNLNECVTYSDFSSIGTITIPSGSNNKLLKWSNVPASDGQTFDSTFNYSQKVPMIIAFQSIRISENFGLSIGLTNSNGGFASGSPHYVAPSIHGALPVGSSQYTASIPNNLIFPNTTYKYFGINVWTSPNYITSYVIRLDFINGNYFHYGPWTSRLGIVDVNDFLASEWIQNDPNYPYSGTFRTLGDYNDFVNSVEKITFIRTSG